MLELFEFMNSPFVKAEVVGFVSIAKRAARLLLSFTTCCFFELRACVNYYSGCLPHSAGQQGVWVRMGSGWLFICLTHAVSLFFLVNLSHSTALNIVARTHEPSFSTR